ncbi:MAG: hypothetical protein ACFFE5_14340 [Candidatus Thorarchaeota archaeon]
MNLKKEIKNQQVVEENEKVLDLNNVKFILSEYEEDQVLMDLIRKVSQNTEINRILIISNDLISLFSQLMTIFPKAQFYIANKSSKILESFKDRYKNQNNYKICILDVFKGVSIHDFIYNNSKFDLVIADKIYSHEKKRKKRYYSINFLYKFYLKQNGILCLLSHIRNRKKDNSNLLGSIKPILEKTIQVKNENYFVQFILYSKKENYLKL